MGTVGGNHLQRPQGAAPQLRIQARMIAERGACAPPPPRRRLERGRSRASQGRRLARAGSWPAASRLLSRTGQRLEILRLAPNRHSDAVNTIGARMGRFNLDNPHAQLRLPRERGRDQLSSSRMQIPELLAPWPAQPERPARRQGHESRHSMILIPFQVNTLAEDHTGRPKREPEPVKARLMDKCLHDASPCPVARSMSRDHATLCRIREWSTSAGNFESDIPRIQPLEHSCQHLP